MEQNTTNLYGSYISTDQHATLECMIWLWIKCTEIWLCFSQWILVGMLVHHWNWYCMVVLYI